jgi:hypothetical protein
MPALATCSSPVPPVGLRPSTIQKATNARPVNTNAFQTLTVATSTQKTSIDTKDNATPYHAPRRPLSPQNHIGSLANRLDMITSS